MLFAVSSYIVGFLHKACIFGVGKDNFYRFHFGFPFSVIFYYGDSIQQTMLAKLHVVIEIKLVCNIAAFIAVKAFYVPVGAAVAVAWKSITLTADAFIFVFYHSFLLSL